MAKSRTPAWRTLSAARRSCQVLPAWWGRFSQVNTLHQLHRQRLRGLCDGPSRMLTWLVCGHLADELLEDGVSEGLVALGRDNEGARAADHVVNEIVIETGFQGQNRQAINDDAGAHRGVAGARGGPA